MHRLAVLAVLCAVLQPAAAARAARGPVVAVSGDAQLHAQREHGLLCLTVVVPGTPESESCDPPPTSPFTPGSTRDAFAEHGGPPVGYAFPAGVATVTSDAGGRVTRHATSAAPGYAARFVVLPFVRTRGAVLRAYDAAGSLVAALQPDDGDGEARQRAVHRAPGIVVRVGVSRRLAPDPLELDRTLGVACLSIRTAGGSTASACTTGPAAFDVDATPLCAPGRTTITGIVPARVRGVAVQLGGGGVLRRATRRLPAAFGARRLVVVPVPTGEAVRAVRALDAAGRSIAARRLGTAPGGLPCPPRDRLGSGSSDVELSVGRHPSPRAAGPLRPVAAAGGHVLLAADGGRRALCTAVDRPVRPRCAVPPVEATGAALDRHGRTLGGVLSRDVARVDLRLDDGSRLQVPTDAGAAYTGRYAGLVRFVAVRLAAGRVVRAAVARDGAGRRLGPLAVISRRRARVTRRALDGGLVLRRQRFEQEGRRSVFDCVLAARPRTLEAAICGRPYADDPPRVAAAVSCAPRRTLVLGRVPAGARGATLTTTDGGRVPARVRRLRGIGRIWSVSLPPGRGVTGADLTGDPRPTRWGPVETHLALRLPPAERQCGYTASSG